MVAFSYLLARGAGALARRLFARTSAQQRMLGQRFAFYGVLSIGVMSALHHIGFDVSTLLGAAGIVTVAIGFAAQTSASNFIAGVFLIGERSFVIGDLVRIGQTTGEVLAIDLLSVKLRTLDNLFVRVPNDVVIKSEVYNLTHFPIRRVDIALAVGYSADLAQVQRTLLQAAEQNPLCLDEPKPLCQVKRFADLTVQLELSVWCARELLAEVQSSLHQQIKLAFEHAGIRLALTPAPAIVDAAPKA
jgi:small-conductance mechanosensitive channel